MGPVCLSYPSALLFSFMNLVWPGFGHGRKLPCQHSRSIIQNESCSSSDSSSAESPETKAPCLLDVFTTPSVRLPAAVGLCSPEKKKKILPAQFISLTHFFFSAEVRDELAMTCQPIKIHRKLFCDPWVRNKFLSHLRRVALGFAGVRNSGSALGS